MHLESKSIWIVTGSSGYLGQFLCKTLSDKGIEVIGLCRKPSHKKTYTEFSWSLGEEFPSELSKFSTEGVIHCAWDFSMLTEDPNRNQNILGIQKILNKKEWSQKRWIFISTMSAFTGCKSIYGKTKLQVEKLLSKVDSIILRPGLLWSKEGHQGGMVGSIVGLAKKIPFLPLPNLKNQSLSATEIQELADMIYEKIKSFQKSETIVSAHPEVFSFVEMVKRVSSEYNSRLIPVPYSFFYYLLRLVESLRVPLRFKSDSLLSIDGRVKNENLNSDDELRTRYFQKRFFMES